MSQAPDGYLDLVSELSATKPKTAALLRHANNRRQIKLREYLAGARLSGFEELLGYLETVEELFRSDKRLAKIAFLLERSRGEFGVALETLLCGMHTVAHDAMRSVMEIEFLFRDFSLEPSRIEDWLTADPNRLNNEFRPSVLRQRFANHLSRRVHELNEAADYKGHSMFLHVGPLQSPFGVPGLARDEAVFAADSCFWEIFEHARRLLIAIETLAGEVRPQLLANHKAEDLEKLGDAWVLTQEMQQIWKQLIGYKSNPEDHDADG
jgi:hypothetical protein